jgi:diguanylate cyclase (GGDEF)-like protein
MRRNEFAQIFDTVNIGLVILDREIRIRHWNRWMETRSGIAEEKIIGELLFDFFPHLNTPSFTKNCRAVLSFGNFAFFSQKLHRFLFPFKPDSSFGHHFDLMQQSCTMGPLRGEDNAITGLFLIVQDVTELATYEQKLIEMNTIDPLTGVHNRRFLESRLKEECDRYARYSRPFSLMMIDIDFFKRVNDTHGHQAGDLVLKNVASQAVSVIRQTDLLARYGGEEFCCLLPETDCADAEIVAESLRAHIEGLESLFQKKVIRVTISLGISCFRQDDSPETLLARADEALYQAKRSGRNRFVRF